jgi:hypothetical protein
MRAEVYLWFIGCIHFDNSNQWVPYPGVDLTQDLMLLAKGSKRTAERVSGIFS